MNQTLKKTLRFLDIYLMVSSHIYVFIVAVS